MLELLFVVTNSNYNDYNIDRVCVKSYNSVYNRWSIIPFSQQKFLSIRIALAIARLNIHQCDL